MYQGEEEAMAKRPSSAHIPFMGKTNDEEWLEKIFLGQIWHLTNDQIQYLTTPSSKTPQNVYKWFTD